MVVAVLLILGNIPFLSISIPHQTYHIRAEFPYQEFRLLQYEIVALCCKSVGLAILVQHALDQHP